MKLRSALRLGRVSNLPTVWTNTLAGAVLAGAAGFGTEFAVMLVAFSLLTGRVPPVETQAKPRGLEQAAA